MMEFGTLKLKCVERETNPTTAENTNITRHEAGIDGQSALQSPGTEPVHRPPGFHASCAVLACARPDVRWDLSVTIAP
jgi:hypothetical protein